MAVPPPPPPLPSVTGRDGRNNGPRNQGAAVLFQLRPHGIPFLLLAALMMLMLLCTQPSPVNAATADANPNAEFPFPPASDASVDDNAGGDYVIMDHVDEVMRNSVLAGKIMPTLSKFAVGPKKLREIRNALFALANPADFALILLLGWVTVPAIERPYRWIFGGGADDEDAPVSTPSGVDSASASAYVRSARSNKRRVDFSQTHFFLIADHVSQMARMSALVYLADCLGVVLTSLGLIKSHIKINVSKVFAQVLYSAWAARRLQIFKRYLFTKVTERDAFMSSRLGRMALIDKIFDGIIMAALALFVLEILQVEGGIALKSVFAFGSAGTLIFTLASKDLASQIVNGLSLMSSDKLYEGEEVEFGDGTVGIIKNLGWMVTRLCRPDGLIVSIPNSQLAHQKLINISRMWRCQVKETLRFRYDDAESMEELLADIKSEIRESCPKLIVDGSCPFRAHWRGFRDDHLEVVVDTHFNVKPTGDVYHDNRQNVLKAIYRAVKRNNVEFVTGPRWGGGGG